MHSFRASKLLFISAPSILVWRSELDVSAPLSLPARAVRERSITSQIHSFQIFKEGGTLVITDFQGAFRLHYTYFTKK